MEKFLNTVISGSGCYLPPNVIKNDYFMDAEFYDTDGNRIDRTNEDIIEKFRELVGITERRYADDGVNNSDMAAMAAEKAIEDWGGDREDLDYVIVAHNYADIPETTYCSEIVPSVSARVKHKLGIRNRQCIPLRHDLRLPRLGAGRDPGAPFHPEPPGKKHPGDRQRYAFAHLRPVRPRPDDFFRRGGRRGAHGGRIR